MTGLPGRGRIVVLQPRRLAARLLAKRVAEERGAKLGGEVGFQYRLENVSSRETRILYVTEGILLRQMQESSTLPGISVLVFDEFHERHLEGDVALARARQIQQTTRPDLKIIVMSATLETALLKDYLAPVEVLESPGKMFPVSLEYLPKPDDAPAWELAAEACERLLNLRPGARGRYPHLHARRVRNPAHAQRRAGQPRRARLRLPRPPRRAPACRAGRRRWAEREAESHRLDQRGRDLADHRRRARRHRQRSSPAWRVSIRIAASTRSSSRRSAAPPRNSDSVAPAAPPPATASVSGPSRSTTSAPPRRCRKSGGSN